MSAFDVAPLTFINSPVDQFPKGVWVGIRTTQSSRAKKKTAWFMLWSFEGIVRLAIHLSSSDWVAQPRIILRDPRT